MSSDEPCWRIRFGAFEADFQTQELRKHGTRIKLSGQPLQILEILVARPGQLVTRAELEKTLWPGQMFGDSSHGLNAAINKLREAVGDSASEPKYIETLPRRGYRFIATLEPSTLAANPRGRELATEVPHEATPKTMAVTEIAPLPIVLPSKARRRPSLWLIAATLLVGVVGLISYVSMKSYRLAVTGKMLAKTADEQAAPKPVRFVEREARRLSVNGNPRQRAIWHPVIWGEGGNAAPQFSPDGKHIAFMSNRNGSWQIWVSNVDGSGARQVSFTESAGTPRWSPDGKSIAFDAPLDGSTWIFVVRVDQNGQARPIAEGQVPSFSRDEKWIYYASERTGDWQVWKAAVDGSSEVQVTFGGGFAAIESTDGYLYYSKSRDPEPEICRMWVKGGEESCGLQHLRPRTWSSWAVTRDGIIFAEDLPNGQAVLSLYDPSRGQVRQLAALRSAPFWVGASMDGKRAIMNDAAERQISMLENLH